MSKAVLTFTITSASGESRTETLSQDIIKVGKDPASHLVVADELASRMHAIIEVGSPSEVSIIDLGNEPATQVNGAPISKSALKAGDILLVGGTQLRLDKVEPVGAEAQPAPIAPAAASSNPFAAGAAPSSNPFAAPGSAPAASNPFAAPAAASNPFAAPGGAPAASNPFAAAAAPSNPFGAPAAPAAHGQVPDDAPAGSYTFEMLQSGPDVSPDDVELANVPAVEVMVGWESNILHVSHLTPPRNFYVGEGEGKAAADFFIPEEKLPARKIPVVIGDATTVAVVIPANATGSVEIAGQPKVNLDQARAQAQPCSELPGAVQLTLPNASKAKVNLNGFVFTVAAVPAGKPLKKGVGAGFDWSVAMYFLLSFAAFGGLLASMAYFVPPMGLSDEGEIDKARLLLIQQYLDAAAEREQEEQEEEVVDSDSDSQEGGTGTRASGEEGAMGKETSTATNKRYAVKGPKDNPDPHLARQAALREAQDFGMIGLLGGSAMGDPNAPTAIFGRDTSLGSDDVSANGNMWGDEIGDAFGAGGLGLSGIGEGGGGRGEGVGLGNIGTMGHGSGTGSGQGFGSGRGKLGGSHKTRVPKVRMGATSVKGRLPAEVIRRIVRQNFGRFRMCYEQGLGRNPNLEGRVAVRFVIGRDGAVSNAGNGGSDIPDSKVVSCVVSAFYGLSFPQPEGGIVSVNYPIMFSPG
jgi:hypothetical protein